MCCDRGFAVGPGKAFVARICDGIAVFMKLGLGPAGFLML